ncbi:MAG: hypothetical protein AB1756_02395 [Acidobacteriota bacterium]
MEKEVEECAKCKKQEDQVRLQKCAICHKLFCDGCSYRMSGRLFCSQYCAEFFFFGKEDED